MIVVTKHRTMLGRTARTLSATGDGEGSFRRVSLFPRKIKRPRAHPKPQNVVGEGGEQRIVLGDVPWSAYIAILEANEERRSPRLSYQDGDLKVVVLSPEHELLRVHINLFLSFLGMVWDIDFTDYGATTFRRADLKKGFEPDISLYIREAEAMRERKRIDRAVDPAPDLVVEVEITDPLRDKLAIYAALGIGEVWRYQGDALHVLILDADGQNYTEQTHSRAFPNLAARDVQKHIEIADTMPRPRWMRRVQDWVLENKPQAV